MCRHTGSCFFVLPLRQETEDTVKDRTRQRKNRKNKQREAWLEKHNAYGVKDLTPYNVVLKLRTNGKAEIALK